MLGATAGLSSSECSLNNLQVRFYDNSTNSRILQAVCELWVTLGQRLFQLAGNIEHSTISNPWLGLPSHDELDFDECNQLRPTSNLNAPAK